MVTSLSSILIFFSLVLQTVISLQKVSKAGELARVGTFLKLVALGLGVGTLTK
jgi:hypothetical protein